MIMDRILVKEILANANGSYPDGGTMLFQLSQPLIDNNKDVCIDMADVETIPTLFMNTSFAQLINKYGKKRVVSSLKFYNITKVQLDRIKKYFSNFE